MQALEGTGRPRAFPSSEKGALQGFETEEGHRMTLASG